MPMACVAELVAHWHGRFLEAGVDAPRLSAQLLLAYVLGMERMAMLLARDHPVAPEAEARMASLAQRRLRGEPVAYLVGEKEFYGLSLTVSPSVLIPRPETEGLVDIVRRFVPADSPGLMVDVGTGSGAVAVALATVFSQARVLGLDISPAALAVAATNVRRLHLASRVGLVCTDLLVGVHLDAVCVVVANLPYVPEGRTLSWEVVGFEPAGALFAGPDGLAVYRRFFPLLASMPRGGLVVCEVDAEHASQALALVPSHAAQAWLELDLAGRPRYVVVVF